MTVPTHEHVTVDEETYWALMYLHIETRRLVAEGVLNDPVLRHYSDEAERLLARTREWNDADPYHSLRKTASA